MLAARSSISRPLITDTRTNSIPAVVGRIAVAPQRRRAYRFDRFNPRSRFTRRLSKSPKSEEHLPEVELDYYINQLPLGPNLRPTGRILVHERNILVGTERYKRRPYYIIYNEKANSLPGLFHPENLTSSTKMKCSVQIVTTPTADTPGTALLLHFDKRRYLVGNIAEGTQRAAAQRRIGLLKVGDIFLTGTVGWGSAGGLLGVILTVADSIASSRESSQRAADEKSSRKLSKAAVAAAAAAAGNGTEKPWLNVHGGENLTHLFATARRFVFRKGMPLRPGEFTAKKEKKKKSCLEASWQDDLIRVWAMVVEPQERGGSPRKRRHQELEGGGDNLKEGENKIEEEGNDLLEDQYHQQRQAVVSSMFNSEWRLDGLFKKKLLNVRLPAAIFVVNKEGKLEKYTGPIDGPDVPDIDVYVRTPWPGAMVEKLPPTSPSRSSVCYIIKNHTQRGKFNAKQAMKLGVKPGPNFGLLTSGESVTTKAGDVVTPEMVMGPSKEGTGFAIVELPDKSYINPLLSREEWSSKEVMAGVGAIFWTLGPGVLEDTRIRNFMTERSELKHIVSSQDICSNHLALESPATAAIRLHLLDPDRFPIPKHSNEVGPQPKGEKPYEVAKPGLTLQLEPSMELQYNEVVQHLNTAKVVEDVTKTEKLMELVKKAQEELEAPGYQETLDVRQEDLPSKDAEVIALGTGSALPSKYRNVSATLLRVPGYGTYLFDCGENTLGQLKRVFGDELPQTLRDLKGIWISHLHADHHLGTVAVIKAWAAETAKDELTKNNKLPVISHEAMAIFLREYAEVEDYGHDRIKNILVAASTEAYFNYESKFSATEQEELGITSIQACSVDHCFGAAAVVFNFANGFKVAYSGDCRPSKDFVAIGQGATLLIHEATFDDAMRSDAAAKKHCTTSEALDVGRQMGARRILLTHFSQRYQKIPRMETHENSDQIAIVAFDYMRVKIGDFAKIDTFRPALMQLYEDEIIRTEEFGRN